MILQPNGAGRAATRVRSSSSRRPSRPSTSTRARSTFQSGLLTYPFDPPKPAYYAFELPIWLPNPKHGSNVSVWGQIRPAAQRKAVLQFKARGSGSWANVATVTGSGADGFFTTHVQLPSAGGLGISWSGPGGVTYESRIATVS